MRLLLAHAADLGTSVTLAKIDDDPHLLGYYSSRFRCVVVRAGMRRRLTRWVLAHELGHAFYDHTCTDVYSTAANERQADRYAALLLIDPADYARLERINDDAHWIADELDVTVEAVDAYRTYWLTRMHDVAYARARMGAGQWDLRAVVA